MLSAAKTLGKLWTRNYILKTVVKISRVPLDPSCWNLQGLCNSTLHYECDETFSDECEFAARAEGEWCNHTCQENVFSHEYRTKFYITRCENADFPTRSVRKTAFTHSEWYKKVLSSEPGELFWRKKFVLLFTKNWWNRGSKFSKKFQTPAICQRKRLLAHCFDCSQTIISHLFWFKRDVFLDNILTTVRGLAKNRLPANLHNTVIFGYFYFKIIWKLLQ